MDAKNYKIKLVTDYKLKGIVKEVDDIKKDLPGMSEEDFTDFAVDIYLNVYKMDDREARLTVFLAVQELFPRKDEIVLW